LGIFIKINWTFPVLLDITITMGILGLLKAVRCNTTVVHVSKYKGETVGVDISCWLHRGCCSCSKEVVEGIPTAKHIAFCIKMLRLLVSHGVIPLVVLDGRPLPAKNVTNMARAASRAEHAYLARQAAAVGQDGEAYKHYQQAVTITSEMTQQLIEALRTEGLQFLVAPYESDAQLAFLAHHNYIAAVLTEDGDALPYGCSRVLFKMSPTGSAEEVQVASLFAPPQQLEQRPVSDFDFCGWTMDQFRLFCCLAGCDYAPKLRHMGIKSAYRLVSRHASLRSLLIALRDTHTGGEVSAAFANKVAIDADIQSLTIDCINIHALALVCAFVVARSLVDVQAPDSVRP
jgi:exonuclease 1